jgi:orotidine-5'-phosphate decarboxylase
MFRDIILESSSRRNSKVILALDPTSEIKKRIDFSMALLSKISDYVAAVKMNYHLLLPFGLKGISKIVKLCNTKKLPLIADLKLNDIGSTNREVCKLLRNHGFDCVIANPVVGLDEGIGVLLDEREEDFGVILLVMASNIGSREIYELNADGKKLYQIFTHKAKEWGADGVVVPSRRIDVIKETRKILGRDYLILSPGIGKQGGIASEAISAGADFVIVGRSIIESENPYKAIKEFNSSI